MSATATASIGTMIGEKSFETLAGMSVEMIRRAEMMVVGMKPVEMMQGGMMTGVHTVLGTLATAVTSAGTRQESMSFPLPLRLRTGLVKPPRLVSKYWIPDDRPQLPITWA
jgi:hypothetical protein